MYMTNNCVTENSSTIHPWNVRTILSSFFTASGYVLYRTKITVNKWRLHSTDCTRTLAACGKVHMIVRPQSAGLLIGGCGQRISRWGLRTTKMIMTAMVSSPPLISFSEWFENAHFHLLSYRIQNVRYCCSLFRAARAHDGSVTKANTGTLSYWIFYRPSP